MDGDSEELDGQVRYGREIAERIEPDRNFTLPVLGPVNYIRAERWRIDRVFNFLYFVSVMCLGALMLRPEPLVEVAVVSIWTGAAGLSRYLLTAAYGGSARRKRP
jgi:hypothetical protein